MSTFKFLNAVREHSCSEEIETFRQQGNSDELFNVEENEEVFSVTEALKFAVMYSHHEYVRYILGKFGDEVLRIPACCPVLILAVRLKDVKMVQVLCEFSNLFGKVNGFNWIDSKGCAQVENEKTALHVASDLGNVKCVQKLLRFGANSQVTDKNGDTPLDRALQKCSSKNNFTCILVLLQFTKQLRPGQIVLLKKLHRQFHEYPCEVKNCSVPYNAGSSSLQHLCKCAIRDATGCRFSVASQYLPIPTVLKNYLNFPLVAAESVL